RETDPTRREIILHRGRLREMRDELEIAPPSSAREGIAERMRDHQVKLASALEKDLTQREAEVADLRASWVTATVKDPASESTMARAESELLTERAELEGLRRLFSPKKAAAVAEKYRKEVRPLPGGGCMTAVYKGLEALYTPGFSADLEKEVQTAAAKVLKATKVDTNHVDRIMETLHAHSKTGERVTVKYRGRAERWTPGVEETVLRMVNPAYTGWYFIGMAVSGGYHSVILAVDNSMGGQPQIYWMDQYSKGFTKNVTG